METGFFLRDTADGHREYECPDPSLTSETIKKVKSIIGPVQMLVALAENEFLNVALRMIETLVTNVFDLVASIEGYRGSEFCSGLLFGRAGSNLVLSLGKDIMEQMENIDALFPKPYAGKTRKAPRK